MQDMIGRVLLHQDLGFGPDLVDTERRLIYPTISKHAVKYRLKLETLSEEMRILYVALTRAREKLVISGSARDYSKSAAKWCESAESSAIMLPTFQTQKALCLFDWIMPALARHRDGEALRNFWNGDVSLLEDASAWNISVWNLSDAKKVNQCFGVVREEVREYFTTAEDNLKGDSSAEKIEQIRSEVRRRLEWAYPYKKLSEIPAKISVTELKRRFNEATDEEGNSTEHYNPPLVKRPSFMETDRGFSAAEAGTIMHFIMQHLELCAISKVMNVGDELRAQIESFVKNELLTRQEADVARVDKIKAFFDSPIGARMLKSHAVYREIPFNMELRVNEVYEMPDGCDDETMLLQGVIDCFFETEEGIVLLDYKTDYVPENGMDEIQARYRTQIDYYARALESMTGKKVSEKYIYLFYNGEIIKY
jgi:ATP-dependent helicase/nuclease subunit A